MAVEPFTSIAELRDRLQKEIPDIRPGGADDWDWTWADEGMDLLETEDYLLAERKFQELILARPDDCDGYEGLALVYQAMGCKREAGLLIDHAVRIAEKLVAKDHIDQEVLDAILAEQQQIQAMPAGEGTSREAQSEN
jgi:tetratricopeptide (TPR) repeat protein